MSERPENDCRLMDGAASSLGSEVLVLRVIRRIDQHSGPFTLTENLNRDVAAHGGKFRFDITQAEALAQRVAVVTGGGASDDVALQIKQRFIAKSIGILDAVNLEGDETMRYARRQLLFKSFLADESALVETYETVQTRLVGWVGGGQIPAPHPIGLPEPQGFHGAHSRHADVEFFAGGK